MSSLLMPLASTIEFPTFFSAVQSLRHNWTGGVDAPRQTLQLGIRWRTTDGRRQRGLHLAEEVKAGEQTVLRRREIC